jgi:hypothetical protein
MPAPPDAPRPFAACPACGKRSRAGITKTGDGKILVHYSATSKPRAGNKKRVRTIRLSEQDMCDIERGAICLTVRNGRITIVV